MILLKLNGDKVIGICENISSDYITNETEVLVNELPHIELLEGERAYMYYKNGKIELEKRGN